MKKRLFGFAGKAASALSMLLFLLLLSAGAALADDQAFANRLRLALLPIPDVLPVYVADAAGYFKEAGIEVEALPVGSAVERDQLMQAGRVDGMINEVGGAALFNREAVMMRIVSYARTPIGTAPLFRILAAPGADLQDVKQLSGVPVAISKNTVIEYITKRLLQAGGVADTGIEYKSVPVLPERFQLLLAGQIKAATLPDPLGYAAMQAGAIEVINDLQVADLSASVVSFSNATLLEKPQVVKKFMAAWAKAAEDLNSDPEAYRQLMLKKIRVPKNVQQSFQIPQFPEPAVPTRDQWDDVQDWMVNTNLLKAPISYEDSVTDTFLSR